MPSSGTFRQYALERITFGVPAAQALKGEVRLLGRRRVVIITNRSLRSSAQLQSVRTALGAECVGVFAEVAAHAPRESVIAGAAFAREAQADLLVALGGGSVIDAAKAMLLCLRHGLTRPEELGKYVGLKGIEPSHRTADEPEWLRMLAIPTTLSAAEYTWFAGVTDTLRGVKEAIGHPLMTAQAVILDPAMTLTVPDLLFLATGVKAIDHAAERLASMDTHPFNDAMATQALTLLNSALPRVKRDPSDLQARLDCQLAMWMSGSGKQVGIGVGASHAIGHVLGAYRNVGHGDTSCVMLPAVMRWNAPVNTERQQLVSAALGQPGAPAAEVLEALITHLGLPRRLREVGIAKADFPGIADRVMDDFVASTNPRPLKGPQDIVEILELAW